MWSNREPEAGVRNGGRGSQRPRWQSLRCQTGEEEGALTPDPRRRHTCRIPPHGYPKPGHREPRAQAGRMGPEDRGPPAPIPSPDGQGPDWPSSRRALGLALGSSPPSLGFLISEWGKVTGPPAWLGVEGSLRPHGAPATRRSLGHQETRGGRRAGRVSSREGSGTPAGQGRPGFVATQPP